MTTADSGHLVRRGQRCIVYMRKRIPQHLRDAYARTKTEVLRSLRTSDADVAKVRFRPELVALDQQLDRMRVKLEGRWKSPASQSVQRVEQLPQPQLQDFAQSWVRMVLETDDHLRQQGLDDEEFAETGARITGQRQELGQLLARGHVTALDYQARRQAGDVVVTGAVSVPAPVSKTWLVVFETWRAYVAGRPTPTTIACRTAWRQLEAFARRHDVLCPAHFTSKPMTALVDHLHKSEQLTAQTINERVR